MAADHTVEVPAPMPAKVLELLVAQGDSVAVDQELLLLESMKMEVPITAPAAGTVLEIRVNPGDSVVGDEVLLVLGTGAP